MRKSAFVFAFLLGLCPSGIAQDVVSASSGVLQYFEGAVDLDDHAIEHKAAVFPSLKDESVLKTGKGRAELLLTPGVFLRLDEETAVKMLSNSLSDTRIELLRGTVLLDNLNAPPSGAITLLYKGSSVHFPQPGIFRIDASLSELQAYSGQAEVRRGSGSASAVEAQHLYDFVLAFTMLQFSDGDGDEFYDWAHNRSDLIVAQNEQAAAEQNDAQNPDPGANGGLFGAVPSFAVPPIVTSGSGYSSLYNLYGYGNSPSALSSSSPLYSPFFFSSAAVVYFPFWPRPTGVKWPPGIGIGNHPRPVLNRWPTSTYAGSSLGIGSGGGRIPAGLSTYVGLSGYRPSALTMPAYRVPGVHVPTVTVPRASPPPPAAHVAAPVIAAPRGVGHR